MVWIIYNYTILLYIMSSFQATEILDEEVDMNISAVDFFKKSEKENQSDIQSIISRLKLTPNITKESLLFKLSQFVINKIISDKIKSLDITKNKDLYIYGNKEFTEKQIIKVIAKQYTDEIRKYVQIYENKIKAHLQIQQLDKKIVRDKQQISMITLETMAFQKTRNSLIKELNTQNSQLIDTLYKQGKIESSMRSQAAKIQFQKDNISAKLQNIKQNYQQQLIKSDSLIIRHESQIQNNIHYRAMIHNHISRQIQNQLSTEIQHKDNLSHVNLLKLQNHILNQQINEHINLKIDLSQNTLKMINILRNSGQNIRDKLHSQSSLNEGAIQNANLRIQQAFLKTGTDIMSKLSNMGINIRNVLNTQEEKTKEITNKIIDTMNQSNIDMSKPTPPGTNKYPLECQGTPVPPDCTGSYWIRKSDLYKNIITGQESIIIHICNAGGHFCASDRQSGEIAIFYLMYKKM